jgi:hypothetical protein
MAAGNEQAAAPGLSDVEPIAFRIQGTDKACTYLPHPGETPAVEIVEGDERAETVISLSPRAWSGLVHDVETPPSLIYHGEVESVRGELMHFVRWEATLRALYTGRPVYDPTEIDLRDRTGTPLDPAQAFTLDDDPADMAHFLREVGYLLVKHVFSPAEVEEFRAAADTLRAAAEPGDQKSWWGKNDEGEAVLCRALQGGSEAALRGLPRDPRILKLIALSDHPMKSTTGADERDGVTVLWKNPGVKEGLSDLPWHRDCGMGGHAATCPTIVGSIFLAENSPEAGALRFLPASWKASYRFAEASDQSAHQGLLVPAEPGDLTIHYGDGWHAAPPPTSKTGPFRCCILVSFEREGAFNHRGERHYNDVLLGDADGQVKHMTKVASGD